MRQRIGLWLGPLLFFTVLLLPAAQGMSQEAQRLSAVTLLMATWWISEALPLAATALLPIALFPLLGILPLGDTTTAYANPMIYLFLGGFLIAMAMQRWGLHRRIALLTIQFVGHTPRRLLLGFMLATAFLSMWISNTATTMMMLPIALAVIHQQKHPDNAGNGFAIALLLGIAYSASIGGVATLIGTPPNAILAGILQQQGITLNFARWLIFAAPLSLLMLLLCWFYLSQRICPEDGGPYANGHLLQEQLQQLGPLGKEEGRVLLVFLMTAAAWIARGLLDIPWLQQLGDAGIAISAALLLFLLPAKEGRLLDWISAAKLPWEILLLFGGGFSLAGAFVESGLTVWLVSQLHLLQELPLWFLLLAITLLIIFLTEVTSNTATATIVLPLMGALAAALGQPPALLMIPAAIAASYAFMLPVATPPNAIVFAGGFLTVAQMAKAGIWMNLMATALITLFMLFSPTRPF